MNDSHATTHLPTDPIEAELENRTLASRANEERWSDERGRRNQNALLTSACMHEHSKQQILSIPLTPALSLVHLLVASPLSSLMSRVALRSSARLMAAVPPKSVPVGTSASASAAAKAATAEAVSVPHHLHPARTVRAVKFAHDPSLPTATRRWQSAPGQDAFEGVPARYPWMRKLAQIGHVSGVLILLSGTIASAYLVWANWSAVRSRRLKWEKDNPEHLAQLQAEVQAKKDAEAGKAAAKYAPTSDKQKPAAA